jgi:hypothetical protein
MPDVDLAKFASRCAINPPGDYIGATIASAATITLSHPVHRISGTTEITTINPPFTGFVGHVTLLPTGAWTTATGGNIATAHTAVANRPVFAFYDGATWYIQAIA